MNKTITLDPSNQKVHDLMRLTWKLDEKQSEKLLKTLHRWQVKNKKGFNPEVNDGYETTLNNMSRICNKRKGEVVNLILSLA